MNIIDNHGLLPARQSQYLHTCCSQYFRIGKYQSIENLLDSLNVDVLIEPGIITRSIPIELNDTKAFWREEANRLEKLNPEAKDRDAAIEDYRDARNNLERISEDLESWASMPLRGLFVPKANIIKLYPEEMDLEYNGACMDELLLSTLVHESMHAYFNRPRHKSYPYVIHVEEPLAEFGMLLFLSECNLCYNWAYNDVSRKKTCYRYGAKLMDQHLTEGQNSSIRQYLEAYKMKLDLYSMPIVNSVSGTVVLPKNHRLNSPIQVGDQMITPRWNDVFKYPPRYFYDQKTGTLGLDGDWSDGEKYHGELPVRIIIFEIDIHTLRNGAISQLYLGENFTIDRFPHSLDLLSKYEVIVSPANRWFFANNGVPFNKNDNKPILDECSDGLYRLYRNGKWGVIDAQMNLIIPFKYDRIWRSFDKNDLIEVWINGHSGLVNKQGKEQVSPIYEHIFEDNDGTYTVKLNGSEFRIDKFGNKQ